MKRMDCFRRFGVAVVTGIVVACLMAVGTAVADVLDLSSQPVDQSSYTFANRTGVKAFDGVATGDPWQSTNSLNNPQWVYVDLGGLYDITNVRIWHGTTYNNATTYTLRSYEGLGAPDPETSLDSWTTIGTMTGRGVDGTSTTVDETWDFVTGTVTKHNGGGTASGIASGAGGVRARFLLFRGENTQSLGAYKVGVYEIEVSGTEVIYDPNLSAPDSYDFGEIVATNTSQQSIAITNIGPSAALNIAGVTPSGGNAGSFTVDSFPATLAAGAGGTISVTFNPDGVSGDYTTSLQISSDIDGTPGTITTVTLDASARGPLLDLAGQPVFWESATFGNRTGVKAFDGVATGEPWEGTNTLASGGTWIYVDLGALYRVDKVEIYHGLNLNNATAYTLRDFDGDSAPAPATSLASWTTIGTMTGRSVDTTGTTADDRWDFVSGAFTALTGSGSASGIASGGVRARFFLLEGVNGQSAGNYEVNVVEIAIHGTRIYQGTVISIR